MKKLILIMTLGFALNYADEVKIYNFDNIHRNENGLFVDKQTCKIVNGIIKSYSNQKVNLEFGCLNGRENGLMKYYTKTGQLLWEQPYKNGKKEGLYKMYNSKNGNLFMTSRDVNNFSDGNSTIYNDDGTKLWEVFYKKGLAIYGFRYFNDEKQPIPKKEIEKMNDEYRKIRIQSKKIFDNAKHKCYPLN